MELCWHGQCDVASSDLPSRVVYPEDLSLVGAFLYSGYLPCTRNLMPARIELDGRNGCCHLRTRGGARVPIAFSEPTSRYTGQTFSASGPLGPCPSVYVTRCLSLNDSNVAF